MERSTNQLYKTHTEQPSNPDGFSLSPAAQEQLVFGSIALGTIFAVTLLIREIRLLVEARKS